MLIDSGSLDYLKSKYPDEFIKDTNDKFKYFTKFNRLNPKDLINESFSRLKKRYKLQEI